MTLHHVSVGEGVPVLALHGWTPDHRLMTGCLEPIFTELPGYRRATYAVLDMAGHNLQIEQPELLSALLREWLDRVARESAHE